MEKGAAHFGKLNVLINSAQTSASGLTLWSTPRPTLTRPFIPACTPTFFYMKYAFPFLKETKDR